MNLYAEYPRPRVSKTIQRLADAGALHRHPGNMPSLYVAGYCSAVLSAGTWA